MKTKVQHFEWDPEIDTGSMGIYEITRKIAVQLIDTEEEMIVEACKDAARKAGVTDLTIIDRDSLIEYFGGVSERQKSCPFCHHKESRMTAMTDDGKYEVWLTPVVPLPAIDLTTGETAKTADPPYHALMMDGEDAGEDILPIRFCPMCGRKLEAENEEADK